MTKALAVAMLVALAACQPTDAPADDRRKGSGSASGACGADGLQGLVGQHKSVLATMTFATTTRVIAPGMAITMDYSQIRLNISIGKDGRILRVYCG
jgi:hypothetical protein